MNLTRTVVLASLAIMVSSSISAVMLSSDKRGQVLIFPYFGTLGGNTTAITISSQSSGSKALKVHFRDRQGEAVLSFNLYLEDNGSWVAGLGQVNGETHLSLPDTSCISPDLNDGSGSVVVPATSGYLEVIEMGTIIDLDILRLIEEPDCEALNALWAENGQWLDDPSFGLGPPVGGVRGSASLINVGHGTMYSFVATALSAFSDIQQHTAPGELLPNLTSAHDAGTEANATISVLCINGECIEDTWERPVDAVAATLLSRRLSGEFSIEPNIGGSTEVILTFPLQKFYFDENNFDQGITFIGLFVYDRTGFGQRQNTICITPVLSKCEAPYQDSNLPSMRILSFNNAVSNHNTTVTSNILSEEHVSFFPSPEFPIIPESGQFEVYLGSQFGHSITSNSRAYTGNPVIGVVLQEFKNGQLTNDNDQLIQANYGNAFELSTMKE